MNRVINFHKVTNAEWFDSVVRFLKSHYTMIHASQLIDYYYNGKELPKKSCLITVDDGDETSYSIIYPILKKYRVSAIFFVSPEKASRTGKHLNFWFQEARNCEDADCLMDMIHAGDYNIEEIWRIIERYQKEHHAKSLSGQNMTLEQIKEIDSEGIVAIGAHTMDHPFLARETDDRSKYEIEESIKELEDILGHSVLSFAYPNGQYEADFGEREMIMVSHTSCMIAFSTQPKEFTRNDSPYAIPRFGLSCGSIPFIRLKLLLGSHYTAIKSVIGPLVGKFKTIKR